MAGQRDRGQEKGFESSLSRLRITYQYLLGKRARAGELDNEARVLREAVASKALLETCVAQVRRAAELELAAGTLSEASLRMGGGKILVSRAGAWFAQLESEDWIIASASPQWSIGESLLPSHWDWHRAIYIASDEAGAVFFGQAAAATAWAHCEAPLEEVLLHDAAGTVGGLARIEPQSEAIGEAALSVGVMLLRGYGILAHGRDLAQAIERVETVNRWCEIALLSSP